MERLSWFVSSRYMLQSLGLGRTLRCATAHAGRSFCFCVVIRGRDAVVLSDLACLLLV